MVDITSDTEARLAFGENRSARIATLLRIAGLVKVEHLANESDWRNVLVDKVMEVCKFQNRQRNVVQGFISTLGRSTRATIRSKCLGGSTPRPGHPTSAEGESGDTGGLGGRKGRKPRSPSLPHESETDEARQERIGQEYADAVSRLPHGKRTIRELARTMRRKDGTVAIYVALNPWIANLLTDGKNPR